MKRIILLVVLSSAALLSLDAGAVNTLYIGSEVGRQVLSPDVFQVTAVWSAAYRSPLVQNSGFERDDDLDGCPDGWQTKAGDSTITVSLDGTNFRSGKTSARIRRSGLSASPVESSLSTSLPVKASLKYRITCFAKAEAFEGQVYLRISGGGSVQQSEPLVPLPDWQPMTVEILPQSEGTLTIECGTAASAGSVWFDDLCVQSGSPDTPLEETPITEEILKAKELAFLERVDLERLSELELEALIGFLIRGGAIFLSGCPGVVRDTDLAHLLPLRLDSEFSTPHWIHFERSDQPGDFLSDVSYLDAVQANVVQSRTKASSKTYLVTQEAREPLLSMQNRIGILTLDMDSVLLEVPETSAVREDFIRQMSRLISESVSHLMAEEAFPVVPNLDIPEDIHVGDSVRFQASVRDLRTQRNPLKGRIVVSRQDGREVLNETVELFTDFSGQATGFVSRQFQIPGRFTVELLVLDDLLKASTSYRTERQVSSPIEISIGEARTGYLPGESLQTSITVRNNSAEAREFTMILVFSGPTGPVDALEQSLSIGSDASLIYSLERPWDSLVSGNYELKATLYEADQAVALDAVMFRFTSLKSGALDNSGGMLTLGGEPFFLLGTGCEKLPASVNLRASFHFNTVVLPGGWKDFTGESASERVEQDIQRAASQDMFCFCTLGSPGHPSWLDSPGTTPLMTNAEGAHSFRTMDLCLDYPEFRSAFLDYMDIIIRRSSPFPNLLGYIIWDRPALPDGGCHSTYTLDRFTRRATPKVQQNKPLEAILETGKGIIEGLDPINQASKLLARPTQTPAPATPEITPGSMSIGNDWIQFSQENLGDFLRWSIDSARARAPLSAMSIKRHDSRFGSDPFALFTNDSARAKDSTTPALPNEAEDLCGISIEQTTAFEVMAEAEYLSKDSRKPSVAFGLSTPAGLSSGQLWTNCWALVAAGQKGVFIESFEEFSMLPLDVQKKVKDFNGQIQSQVPVWASPKTPATVAVLDSDGGAVKGAYELARRSGYHVDIVSPKKLSDPLIGYEALLAPTGFRDALAVEGFRKSGGVVMFFDGSIESGDVDIPDGTTEAVYRTGLNSLYCTFTSDYSDNRRVLVESALAEFGIEPPVRPEDQEGRTAPDVLTSMLEFGKNRYVVAINTGSEGKKVRLTVAAPFGDVHDLVAGREILSESEGPGRWSVEANIDARNVLLLAFTPDMKSINLSAPEEVYASSSVSDIKTFVDTTGERPLQLDLIRPDGVTVSTVHEYGTNGPWKTNWEIPRNSQEGVWRLRLRDCITRMESIAIVEVLPPKKSSQSLNRMTLKSR